ncbi:collagenase [Longispora albida]|uniref:collagenase n=1 Tax=Longispora albida TaxID=203523 RepID=UPI00037E0697|nr:collagenase [Longispora albida]
MSKPLGFAKLLLAGLVTGAVTTGLIAAPAAAAPAERPAPAGKTHPAALPPARGQQTATPAVSAAGSVLTISYSCDASHKIRAQDMTSSELAATCQSLLNQDAFFYGVVGSNGQPVANDLNTSIEINVYNSSTDYQNHAGAEFGISTNNGGMYLEGDPSRAGNQARFIAYEAEWLRPVFAIWNLNHEYTHYLDGRYDMWGDFRQSSGANTIWWIEGVAEYVSYSYRGVAYTSAIAEARKGTYTLSTVFDTTYRHSASRIYDWGYLGVRYMLERHPADVTTLLGYYRAGKYTNARNFLRNTIGTRYDADFKVWLAACGAGACS